MDVRMKDTGRWRAWLWLAIAAALLAPAIAMRFTDEVRWTATDFVAAALLLGGGALLFEVARRLLPPGAARWIAGGVIAVAVVVVWAQGAVGIA